MTRRFSLRSGMFNALKSKRMDSHSRNVGLGRPGSQSRWGVLREHKERSVTHHGKRRLSHSSSWNRECRGIHLCLWRDVSGGTEHGIAVRTYVGEVVCPEFFGKQCTSSLVWDLKFSRRWRYNSWLSGLLYCFGGLCCLSPTKRWCIQQPH
jgi:hypothetical protein